MPKTALITGASGGIGAELAKIFAREGCDLVLTARSEQKLNALKTELETKYKISAAVFPIDLSQNGAAAQIYGYIEQNNINVDILVNNAGFGDFGSFAASDLNRQCEMLRLNVISLTELTHYCLKGMLSRKYGKILNLASTAAFQPGPLMSVYYASKAYVLSFSEAVAAELKNTGVTVTALCPGPTKTGFEAAANLNSSGLFKNLKTASVERVAEEGYNGLMKGRMRVIPGFGNKLLVVLSKLMPRAVVRNVVYKIQKVR